MPTDHTPLLAVGAGVGAFVLGRVLLRPAEATPAPAADQTAQPITDPLLGDSASIEFPGTLQGIDQGLPPDAGGPVSPPYPLPVPTPTPTPVPAPKPIVYPIAGVKPPSGSTGVARAVNLKRLFTVSGGIATAHSYSGLNFSAYIGPAATYKPNATLRKILSGTHAGLYVHPGDAGLTITGL